VKQNDRLQKKAMAELERARRKQRADQKKQAQRESELNCLQSREQAYQESLKKRYVRTEIAPDLRSQVLARAPKLKEMIYQKPLELLKDHTLEKDWIRPIADWVPRGKSRDTQFFSLAEHLLSRYKTPQFLWSAFFDFEHAEKTVPLVIHVARGGSLYDKVKDGSFPVPFTRKLCHQFLSTTSDYTFMSAVRKTQVEAEGGDRNLFRIWSQSRHALRLQTAEVEAFWATVLQFFARTTMLDPAQIGPLIDYIQNRYTADKTYSMKGRSILALMRDRDEWHQELAAVKVFKKRNYEPSGFKQAQYTKQYPNLGKSGHYQVNWYIFEILTATELADEGRSMRHCVYSYASRIERGDVSIWSLCGESKGQDLRYLTIEVNNRAKAIVQVRGICNSRGNAPELGVVSQWASENGLTMSLYGW